ARVDDENPYDVRIDTETHAFLGDLYYAQVATGWSGAIAAIGATAVGAFWARKRRILAAHPWRRVTTAPGSRPKDFVVESDRGRYRTRHGDLIGSAGVQVAGPIRAAPQTYSVVRRDGSNKLYVVRGPRVLPRG